MSDYESIAEMLPSILSNPSAQCPLCGRSGMHEHTPEEIIIYRNGMKHGRSSLEALEAQVAEYEARQIVGNKERYGAAVENVSLRAHVARLEQENAEMHAKYGPFCAQQEPTQRATTCKHGIPPGVTCSECKYAL